MKRKIKGGLNIILGSLIFFVLIGYAFSVSYLFGLFFFVGFIWETSSGRLKKRPALPLLLFIGGLIIRVAVQKFLSPIFTSQTITDLIFAGFLFLGIYLIGYKIKKY